MSTNNLPTVAESNHSVFANVNINKIYDKINIKSKIRQLRTDIESQLKSFSVYDGNNFHDPPNNLKWEPARLPMLIGGFKRMLFGPAGLICKNRNINKIKKLKGQVKTLPNEERTFTGLKKNITAKKSLNKTFNNIPRIEFLKNPIQKDDSILTESDNTISSNNFFLTGTLRDTMRKSVKGTIHSHHKDLASLRRASLRFGIKIPIIPTFIHIDRSRSTNFDGQKTVTNFKRSRIRETIDDIYNKQIGLIDDLKEISKSKLANSNEVDYRKEQLIMDKKIFGTEFKFSNVKDTFYNQSSNTVEYMNKPTSDILKLGDNILRMNDQHIIRNVKKLKELQNKVAVEAHIPQEERKINFIKGNFRRVSVNDWKIQKISNYMSSHITKYNGRKIDFA
jgi:hypothetical protein